MKKTKIGLFPLALLLVTITVSGCSYSSYPPRPYYGNAYGYDYGYGNRYVHAPRVVVVRPAPRVVYRNAPSRYRYNVPDNAHQQYNSRQNAGRSNQNYRSNSNAARSRSYGPR